MSQEALPISPARFAEAIKDLPISTLHLKAAELRNSIAHLDYSNEQLLPFTEGTEPDQDCVDAIRENEVVIQRMQERIELLKKEVEDRGASWTEFQSSEELAAAAKVNGVPDVEGVNGIAEAENGQSSDAWRDGTFTTGRIVNGEVVMDGESTEPRTDNSMGGRLDDEALRRAVEDRLREDEEEEGGMHL
ncbi:hypothetical protein BP5796_00310 [Coleophoma crateriformis]|uniref:Translation machinery-associated protein 17 n=1 Tax=Coleophoma crateriformis TaxID=565419 RepID=A0A3D8T7L6_9HELO|nr:hypothetical protein BP5796_00310 [Coleophoma crateriformis]